MEFLIEENRILKKDEEGKVLAEIEFQESEPGVFDIFHTFVDESLRGQGIASQLVEKALEEIRKKGGKPKASCSYAQKWIIDHPEIKILKNDK